MHTSLRAWSKRYCFRGCVSISFNRAGRKAGKFPIATDPNEYEAAVFTSSDA